MCHALLCLRCGLWAVGCDVFFVLTLSAVYAVLSAVLCCVLWALCVVSFFLLAVGGLECMTRLYAF